MKVSGGGVEGRWREEGMSGGRKEAEGSCVRLEVIPTPALMCPSLKQLLLKLNMLDVCVVLKPHTVTVLLSISPFVSVNMFYVFKCSYICCTNVYGGYILLLDWFLFHYAVPLFVTYYNWERDQRKGELGDFQILTVAN